MVLICGGDDLSWHSASGAANWLRDGAYVGRISATYFLTVLVGCLDGRDIFSMPRIRTTYRSQFVRRPPRPPRAKSRRGSADRGQGIIRHRLIGYLDQRVPGLSPASSSRKG